MIIGNVLVRRDHRYMGAVLERAGIVCDMVHVTIAAPQITISNTLNLTKTVLRGSEGSASPYHAWRYMVKSFHPNHGDFIISLTESELLIATDVIRKLHQDRVYGFTCSYLWDERHIRTDGMFRPKLKYRMVPYMGKNSVFRGADLVPAFARQFPVGSHPVGDIVDVSFLDPEYRQEMVPSLGTSVVAQPQLEPWDKGGLGVKA